MYEHTLPLQIVSEKTFTQPILGNTFGLLAKEYEYWLSLFGMQPEVQKHTLEIQSHRLAEALSQGMTEATITFPENLVFPVPGNGHSETKSLPLSQSNQTISIKNRRHWFSRETLLEATQKQIVSLEASSSVATAAFGGLLRFVVAHSMIYDCLPAGKQAMYASIPGEDIPSLPQSADMTVSGANLSEAAFTRLFYLPQWVAFGESGQLLVESIDEAEACILSMQHYLGVLYGAVALAPYMTVDQVYQQKYYGILGQLVNQGRRLCYFRTNGIITTIQGRVAANNLNRGLRITLPYFDDQNLLLRKIEFEIIPPGRVMFTPAFLIMAILEQMNIARHDTALNFSTRKHLLVQLGMIEKAFDTKID